MVLPSIKLNSSDFYKMMESVQRLHWCSGYLQKKVYSYKKLEAFLYYYSYLSGVQFFFWLSNECQNIDITHNARSIYKFSLSK
jgi:hypothetical protein